MLWVVNIHALIESGWRSGVEKNWGNASGNCGSWCDCRDCAGCVAAAPWNAGVPPATHTSTKPNPFVPYAHHQHPIPQITPRSCTDHAAGERTWTSVLRPPSPTPGYAQLPACGFASASFASGEVTDGLRARRKPLSETRDVGSYPLRSADRQLGASAPQPPPRITRRWPLAAP